MNFSVDLIFAVGNQIIGMKEGKSGNWHIVWDMEKLIAGIFLAGGKLLSTFPPDMFFPGIACNGRVNKMECHW